MAISMKKETMIQTLDIELEHIPRGLRRSPQNEFRMMYSMYRREDLSSNPETSRSVSLRKALQWFKKEHPNEHAQFDSKFFEIPNDLKQDA